jgi:hypothetical protein
MIGYILITADELVPSIRPLAQNLTLCGRRSFCPLLSNIKFVA